METVFFIKISGSGTKQEIINALKNSIQEITLADEEFLSANNWEDGDIITQISSSEPNERP